MIDSAVAHEIELLEARRIHALINDDWASLAAMLTDDLVHVHANGKVDDKTAYLSAVANKYKFLKIERSALNTRSFGDTVISVGPLNQSVILRETGADLPMTAIATQLWVRTETGWLLSSFQATRIA
jgi:ketosteroid isomerase-like protein